MASDVFRCMEGLHMGKHFSDDTILSTLAYKPRPGDLFLVSYPKAGSTWTQHMIYNVLVGAKDTANPFDLFIRFPCLELQGAQAAMYAPRPCAFKSHLPFDKMPYSPEAKYIYIARNPYDTCVSFYYHTKHIPVYRFQDGTFDEFFELFMQGRVEFGDYFENVTSWYEHRSDPNVLFLTYEELKKDTRHSLLKIARFMGMEWDRKLQESPELLDRVLEKTSLLRMKKFFDQAAHKEPLSRSPMLRTIRPELLKGVLELLALMEAPMTANFIRQGKVGDWRNHFSPDQIRRMKEKIAEASKKSDFMSLWKDIDIP